MTKPRPSDPLLLGLVIALAVLFGCEQAREPMVGNGPHRLVLTTSDPAECRYSHAVWWPHEMPTFNEFRYRFQTQDGLHHTAMANDSNYRVICNYKEFVPATSIILLGGAP